MTKISVVIPTYNRLDRLKRVLAALEKQTFPSTAWEVVVVSDGSQDGTNEYLQSLHTPLRLTPVLQENQGVAAARNAGIARAQGHIVLFIDDDVVPVPELMQEHWRIHETQGDGIVVIGPMITPPDFQLSPGSVGDKTGWPNNTTP